MIPGSNLFAIASGIIALQDVLWFSFSARTVTTSGKYINSYGLPQVIRGSFQSVRRQMVNHLGLDLNKTYKMLYTNDSAFDVDRNRAGDRFVVNGRLYDAVGSGDWAFQDAWKSLLLVDVGPATDFINYIVTTDPAVTIWDQTIDFKAGVPVRILVTAWTAVSGFDGSIATVGLSDDVTAAAIAIINGSEYEGNVQFIEDFFVPFFDDGWPASPGNPVYMEITSPIDMTGRVILSGGGPG